jgi:hypothetical protein
MAYFFVVTTLHETVWEGSKGCAGQPQRIHNAGRDVRERGWRQSENVIMLPFKTAGFGAMAVVLLCGSMAVAQQRDGRGDDTRLKTQPAPKGGTKTTPAMTADELGKMLKDMGYQFQTQRLDNGAVIYQLTIKSNGMNVPMDVELSKDGTKVWLTVWFRQLGPNESIPSDVMTKMLESNGRFGPCFFSISTGRQPFLGLPLDNRNLASEDVRRQIDIFIQVYQQTEPLWNTNKWNPQVGGGR